MNPWSLFPAGHFDKWAIAWDLLNSKCCGPPFLQARFVGHALRHFGTGREVVAVARAHGDVTAMAILVQETLGRWRTFQPSQLPLGAWLMQPEAAYASLSQGLFDCLPGCPLMLSVTQQDPLMFRRPASSPLVSAIDYLDTGWLEFEGDFDSYWRGRSAHLRQNMRTQRTRLQREGIVPCLEELTDPVAVADAIADYARLESCGWKAAAGTALTPTNRQSHFYRDVLEDFCANGQGRIYRLSFSGRTVAVDLCVAAQGVETLLKTTYDERVRGISPSTMLKHLAWQRNFETMHVRRCEFFGPFMPWTSLWTNRRRTLFHVNCFRWAAIDRLRTQVRGWRRAAPSTPDRTPHALRPAPPVGWTGNP